MPASRFLPLSLLLFCAMLFASAQNMERILNYHSDITINKDSTMLVRETITVVSLGQQIRRGIDRDFPTRYPVNNRIVVVSFDVQSVTRDGRVEPYRLERIDNGVRVRIGSADVMLNNGEHTYVITYATSRQLGYFENYDELYWNVTGNSWVFPIEKASATVTLPPGIPNEQIHVEGYTGLQGTKGQNYTASVNEQGQAVFATTQPLSYSEGLTIVVTFPKGVVSAPPVTALLLPYLPVIVAGIFLLLLAGYYYLVWYRVGRDPKAGVIIPQFAPPKDVSPAAARFLTRMGADNQTFTAAVMNLAVKGIITIEKKRSKYTLRWSEQAAQAAQSGIAYATKGTPEEQSILNTLLDGRWEYTFTQSDYTTAQQAKIRVDEVLQRQYGKGRFFNKNIGYIVGGFAITAVMTLIVYLLQQLPQSADLFSNTAKMQNIDGALPIVGLIFTIFGAVILTSAITSWRAVLASPGGRGLLAAPQALISTVISIPMLGFGIFALISISSTLLFFLLLALAINIFFAVIMKAYSVSGRRILDHLEGFKLYLTVAEKDRLNFENPPELTPQLFEQFLPYALALGVEQQWSQQFNQALARAGEHYEPTWYIGPRSDAFLLATLGNSLSSAVGAASTAPASTSSGSSPGSSSGSGGGGSSGGGGGGGGGGGW